MLKSTIRILFVVFGWFFVALGIIGILLPLVPTTPFLLLAAFCFSKGSERIHNWILNHRFLGPPIKDWQQFGVIRKRAKLMATFLITLFLGYPILFVSVHWGVKVFLMGLGVSLLLFINSRPSEPTEASGVADSI